ncbi:MULTISPECIES: phage tail fiber protein [unclassified Thioalkalivibrio]|uniref:phage tail fiber domain-containing protein n=1 Tax=unclassified Thioalkalivibrio TaxID=2621013 RepID=UPI0003790DCD|nr:MULTISPECIES: phage tail fiber protein [unclassified Thioalkalivibrio]
MALARVQYLQGSPGTKVFVVPFPYINRFHVKVSVNGVEVDFKWLNGTTIELEEMPEENDVIDIVRETDRETLLVDFQDGSTMTEAQLDLASRQSFYLAQEAFDLTASTLAVANDGSYSASFRRITNLLYPQTDVDAANVQYVKDVLTSSKDAFEERVKAETARTETYAARDLTLTYRNTANQHRLTAEAHRDTANQHRLDAAASAVYSDAQADRAEVEADRSLSEANRAEGEADRSRDEADRAQALADSLESVPGGAMVMWPHAVSLIPAGWVLCDGTNGTPDMRGLFPVGAGGGYSLGATGGANTKSHSHGDNFSVDNHTLNNSRIPSHRHQGGHVLSTSDLAGYGTTSGTSRPRHTGSTSGSRNSYPWSNYTGNGDAHAHGLSGSVSSATIDVRPPYRAIHFIMKL